MKFISVRKKIYTLCCLQVTRIRNTLQTRSTLKSRFVSNSHCNLIFFWDFFEDHVVNLKKKYLIELITFCEFIRYVEHFLLPSFLVVLVPN